MAAPLCDDAPYSSDLILRSPSKREGVSKDGREHQVCGHVRDARPSTSLLAMRPQQQAYGSSGSALRKSFSHAGGRSSARTFAIGLNTLKWRRWLSSSQNATTV